MADRISQRVAVVPPSGIRKFFDIAATMEDVISLGIGEPDFVTPDVIRQAGIASLRRGETRYTSNSGILELRQALSAKWAGLYGVEYDPEAEVLITVGGSEALYLALTAILNPGDEVIVPEPCFVSYEPEVILAGGVPVPIATQVETTFQVTGAQIEAAVTPRTKAILINYPNNPTGAVLDRERMLEIAAVAERHDSARDLRRDLRSAGLRRTAHHLQQPARHARAHDHHRRLLQGLRHDRLAAGLRPRSGRYPGRHAQDPPVHHHVGPHHRPGSRHHGR